MSVIEQDIVVYGSTVMPDSDGVASVGGSIDTSTIPLRHCISVTATLRLH